MKVANSSVNVWDEGRNSRSILNCSLTSTECLSETAVKLKCRVPGYLGCFTRLQSTQVSNQLQSFPRHVGRTDMECASMCREQRQGRGVAVIHQRACLCVPSETFVNLSSPKTYLREWSCPSQLIFRSDVFYAYRVSYGFCNQIGIVRNGTWDSNSTWFGSIVTLTCDKGFVLNGSATLQCAGLPGRSAYFPTWNSSLPSCEQVETSGMFCKHPPNQSNGEWNSTDSSLGSSITLACNDNYVINGSATVRCIRLSDNNSLAWNASFPTCLTSQNISEANELNCGHPSNVSHGTWNLNTTRLGSIIILGCDDGYTPNGSATLLCVGSSPEPIWNGSIPFCQKTEPRDDGHMMESEGIVNEKYHWIKRNVT
ncbi:seizure protein 6 homolog [Diadema setosum]|uniref:seizure protein 6 homolog n=1 Tax=Diadema setosum TaxID=31175 RepID=UPI003B3BACBB